MEKEKTKSELHPALAVEVEEVALQEDGPVAKNGLTQAILSVRWLQLPLLVGLVIGLLIFEYQYFVHLLSMIFSDEGLSKEKAILTILDLADMVLIANLVVMVIISGYKIFISPIKIREEANVPDWLRGLTLAGLKFRIAATVLLISTIHLLHEILDPAIEETGKMVFILCSQLVLVITATLFAWLERMEREH